MTTMDIASQIQTLREGTGAVRMARSVVRADGNAVVDYLQGQISQDVAALAVGDAAWSFVLQPQGKVEVWFRVTRLEDAAFLLDADPGWGEALIARLERFRLSTPVEFELLDWSAVAVRGAKSTAPNPGANNIVVPVGFPGNRGWDIIGPSVEIPEGIVECRPEALEVLRIESGLPAMGAEITEDTIPAAAGVVPMSVSFTKGCYTGQELVARIDSRGSRTPRRLVGVTIKGNTVPDAGAELWAGEDKVGWLTSVAALGTHGGPVGLAYLARKVDTPTQLSVGSPNEIGAEAVDLSVDI